mgnify:CR=1 FL=1
MPLLRRAASGGLGVSGVRQVLPGDEKGQADAPVNAGMQKKKRMKKRLLPDPDFRIGRSLFCALGGWENLSADLLQIFFVHLTDL